MFRIGLALAFAAASPYAPAADPVSKETLRATLDAVGGEAKLFKLFRMKEKLVVNEDSKAKGSERTSVCEPPKYWWLGKAERVAEQKEPVIAPRAC